MNSLQKILPALCCCAALVGAQTGTAGDWYPFGPPVQSFEEGSVIDLRHLNETCAGERGWITTEGDHFIHADTGQTVRFWGANIAPRDDFSLADWQYLARLLAKYGVNQLRLHGAVINGEAYTRSNQSPGLDPLELSDDKVEAIMRAVSAMKAEGIYTHLSIYFPLWFTPPAKSGELPGYDGETKAFAVIYFNDNLQKRYDSWWQTLLTRVNPHTGLRLIDDPAVMSVELVNEDSLFFPTFSYQRIPSEQMQTVEALFGAWLVKKYGSLEAIEWLSSQPHERDRTNAGRFGFGDLREMAQRRSPRDQDTVAFLFELQRDWYAAKTATLRGLGFKGLVTASNWFTADDAIYDGLERATYLAGDFIDHHKAYFSGRSEGENSSWSIRNDHRYYDRSQLRFDPADPEKSTHSWDLTFVKPTWNDRPTMISETSWTRPNRHRSESPGIYAAYGSLHDVDSIVHFALDSNGRQWTVQPRYAMQQWTLLSPAVMGQFPATALMFRTGMIQQGGDATVLEVNLSRQLALEGLPHAQRDGVDALRDLGQDEPDKDSTTPDLNDLRNLVGKTRIHISERDQPSAQPDLSAFIDLPNRQVRSMTGELHLDWGAGHLRIDATGAQGFLISKPVEGSLSTTDLSLRTMMEILNLFVVSLDGSPLITSRRMLLQVVSEEKNSGFTVEQDEKGMNQIIDIGRDPWLLRAIEGEVTFSGEPVRVTALDPSGYRLPGASEATSTLRLLPDVVYYLIER